jgi:hypothetical protein
MEYRIVDGAGPDELTTEVNRLMLEGWRVAGGIQADHTNYSEYLQAMTRDLPQPFLGGGSRRKKPTRRIRKTRRYRK